MSDFTLYIGNKNYSSWSLRGWLPLELSGADYKEVKLPLDTPEFYASLEGITPIKTVPVLVHHSESGDITTWDSLAVIDYLARIFPDAGLWPSAPEAYAYARSVTAEMHAGFPALRGAAPMNIRSHFTGLGFSEPVTKDIKRVEALLCEARSRFGAGGPYLFGANMNAVDAYFAPVISRFKTYDIKLSPVATAYAEAILEHPAVQKWTRDALDEGMVVDLDEIDPAIKTLGA